MSETDISKKLFLYSFRKDLIHGKEKVFLQLLIKIKKHQPVVILKWFYFFIFYSTFFYTQITSLFSFLGRFINRSWPYSHFSSFFFQEDFYIVCNNIFTFFFFFFRKILIPFLSPFSSFFYDIQTTNLSTFFIFEKIYFI